MAVLGNPVWPISASCLWSICSKPTFLGLDRQYWTRIGKTGGLDDFFFFFLGGGIMYIKLHPQTSGSATTQGVLLLITLIKMSCSVVHANWWMMVRSSLSVLSVCSVLDGWPFVSLSDSGTGWHLFFSSLCLSLCLSLSLSLSAVLASEQLVAGCSLPLQHAVHVINPFPAEEDFLYPEQ